MSRSPPVPPRGAAQPLLETPDWGSLPLDDLLQILHSRNSGLTASEAAAILETAGLNRIDAVKRKSLLIVFIERFGDPLVLILLFAAAVSAFTGDVASFANYCSDRSDVHRP